LDEAQNTTIAQMKMTLTRLGEGSRMVINGDPSQIDLPRPDQSGLLDATRVLKSLKDISFITFDQSDVVRHHLVAKIVGAYDKNDKKSKAKHK
jgi:phosphate starvation-inducible PhoH-like protein